MSEREFCPNVHVCGEGVRLEEKVHTGTSESPLGVRNPVEYTYTKVWMTCPKCRYSMETASDFMERTKEAADAYWRSKLAEAGMTEQEVAKMKKSLAKVLRKAGGSDLAASSFIYWIQRKD